MAKKLEQSVMSENTKYQEEMNADGAKVQSAGNEDMMLQQTMDALEREQAELHESGSVENVLDKTEKPAWQSTTEYDEIEIPGQEHRYQADTKELTAKESELIDEPSEQTDYKNIVAKMVSSIAGMFPENSAIGKSLRGVADKLEGVVSKTDGDLSIMQQNSDDEAANETKSSSEYGRQLDKNAEEAQREAELNMLQNRDVSGFVEKSDNEILGMTKEDASEYTLDKRAYDFQESEKQLEKSNGHPDEGETYIKEMENRAVTDVELNEMVAAADTKPGDFKSASGAMLRMNESLSGYAAGEMAGLDVGDKQKANVADAYMNMMRGISAYDTKARETIDLKYADDPVMKEQALTGLGNMMKQTVGDGYNMVGQADRMYGCLSDKDRQELNEMSFTGVELSYSDYRKLQNETSYDADTYSPEEEMYGTAGLYDDLDNGSSQNAQKGESYQKGFADKKARGQKERGSRENHSDYGAKAAEKFGYIVEADKQSHFDVGREMGE